MLSGSIRMEGMQDFQYWMDKESLTYITAKWFLIITFPLFIFSIVKITYMLKVLRVANSDKIFFKLHTHCKNQAYLIV